MTFAGAAKWWQRAGSAMLVAMVCLAYSPSLGHLPRADQWGYLVSVADWHRFDQVLVASYSYNRTLAGGDTDLFRPVLFTLLAAEKALFGNNFALVQATGILLHVLVVLLLLQVLLHIARRKARYRTDGQSTYRTDFQSVPKGPCLLAFGIVAFFALNFAGQELVIWSHINGYLLFLVFLLGSLLLLLKYIRNAEGPIHDGLEIRATAEAGKLRKGLLLSGAWLLALLSAFTYELGQFYAVFAGLFLAARSQALHRLRRPHGWPHGWPHGRPHGQLEDGGSRGQPIADCRFQITDFNTSLALFLWFAAVLVLYQAANHLDKHIQRETFRDENLFPVVCKNIMTTPTLEHAARFVLYTIFQPFFPSAAECEPSSRLVIREPHWIGDGGWAQDPARLVSWLTLGLFVALTLLGLRRLSEGRGIRDEGRGTNALVFVLAFGLFTTYMLMTVLGRMNLRPAPEFLSSNSYYSYMSLLFFLMGCFTALQSVFRSGNGMASLSSGQREAPRGQPVAALWSRAALAVLLLGLVFLSAWSGSKVRQVNSQYRGMCRDLCAAIKRLDRFVRSHEGENGFSFTLDRESSDRSPVDFPASGPGWSPSPPLGEYYGVPLATIFFKRYLNHSDPRYIISWHNGRPVRSR